jgi:uncharacterized protein (TIGR03435 family)
VRGQCFHTLGSDKLTIESFRNHRKAIILILAMTKTIALLMFSCAAQAQSLTAFEVASVKPSTSVGNAKTIHVDAGVVSIRGMSLKDLMLRAYGHGHALQISRSDLVAGGAQWCADDLFDVDAKPGGNPLGSGEDVSAMLRALLADRFRLALHHETRETSGYLLTVTKGGPKMKIRTSGDGGEVRTGTSRRVTEAIS